MNHKAIIQHESGIEYQRRNYVLHLLDDHHFSSLNGGGHALGLNGYCLDAPRSMPAGCTEQGHLHPAMQSVERGVTLAEKKAREREVGRIVSEIIAEVRRTMQAPKGED